MKAAGIESVIELLDDMSRAGIIGRYAVGGAFAATLHNEPIATVDLDIFFLLIRGGNELILSLSEIYEYAANKGFSFDHEFIIFKDGLFSLLNQAATIYGKRPSGKPRPFRFWIRQYPLLVLNIWLRCGYLPEGRKIIRKLLCSPRRAWSI